jgi:hypothetical protein
VHINKGKATGVLHIIACRCCSTSQFQNGRKLLRQDNTSPGRPCFNMDPVAVFRHSDLRRECITDRNWQRLGTDRVSACQFDPSGKFAAVCSGWNAIELWDFTSVPVIETSLGLPKHLSNRIDGICQALAWSPCSSQVAGVFGPRPSLKRKAAAIGEGELSGLSESYRDAYFIHWDVLKRRIIHKYRSASSLRGTVTVTCLHSRLNVPTQTTISCKRYCVSTGQFESYAGRSWGQHCDLLRIILRSEQPGVPYGPFHRPDRADINRRHGLQ